MIDKSDKINLTSQFPQENCSDKECTWLEIEKLDKSIKKKKLEIEGSRSEKEANSKKQELEDLLLRKHTIQAEAAKPQPQQAAALAAGADERKALLEKIRSLKASKKQREG